MQVAHYIFNYKCRIFLFQEINSISPNKLYFWLNIYVRYSYVGYFQLKIFFCYKKVNLYKFATKNLQKIFEIPWTQCK